jgi:hypothetical protein
MSFLAAAAVLLVGTADAKPQPLRFWIDDFRYLPNVTSFLRT